MRRISKWYIALIGAIGMAISCYYVWRLFIHATILDTPQKISIFVTLTIIYWICCCLPLYVRDDCTVDLSFISILAAVLLIGPGAAVVISLIAYPLSVFPSPDGKRHQNIFNIHPLKTLFNIGNHSISYAVGGLVFHATGWPSGDISLPGVLLPAIGFIVLSMVVNVITLMLYYKINDGAKFFPTVIQMFAGLIPSIALSASIGYFLALLMHMINGVWLALLFMLPLFLARYTFKLYLAGQRQQYSIVHALAAALEAKDPYTNGHSARVASYSVQIAKRMNLSDRQIQQLSDAAIFHDIGKIGVPDRILQKPGPLTAEERTLIQRHPQTGVEILQNIDAFHDLIPLILHHHEFFDGRGYPDGTSGDQISIEVYILSAADAFDAITSDRPYRKGISSQQAAEILAQEAGKQFHPEVSQTVVQMVGEGALTAPDAEVYGGEVISC